MQPKGRKMISSLSAQAEADVSEFQPPSLHDALPIWFRLHRNAGGDRCGRSDHPLLEATTAAEGGPPGVAALRRQVVHLPDRKSTRLNSSHVSISYAVFCLKKKISAIIQLRFTS